MKKTVIICGLLFLAQSAYSEIVIDSLQDPEYLNDSRAAYNSTIIEQTGINPKTNTRTVTVKRTSNLNSGQLSKIERKVFGRTYVGDDATNRLQRLESNVYGAIQRGDERNRLTRLSSATQNYSNKYPEYAYNNSYYNYNNYYNNPYYNRYTPYRPYNRLPRLRNVIRNLRNGSLTGYTPPLSNSFNNSMSSSLGNYLGYNNTQNSYYNPGFGYSNSQNSYYNNGYSWSNNYQNPFSGSTYSTYSNPQNTNIYYTSTNGNTVSNGQFTDLFSNGSSGSETYYDDGRYRRNLSSTSGGCGVKVIY